MMANGTLRLQIITPENLFYEAAVTSVIFRTTEGDIGVLPGHIPLTTMLDSGTAVIKTPEGERQAILHKGFAKITGEEVTILTDAAEWPEHIDIERAEQAKKRAEARLSDRTQDIHVPRAEAALNRALVRLQCARGYTDKNK